jgi:hypothetical protein
MTTKLIDSGGRVNAALVHGKFTFLLGEICVPCGVVMMDTTSSGGTGPETTWRAVVLPHRRRAKRQQVHRGTRRVRQHVKNGPGTHPFPGVNRS